MYSKHHSIGNLPGVRQGMQNRKFIQQKLGYIHPNPCKAKLVELPEQYEHSSAKYYFIKKQGIYPVTNLMELRDIDLTRWRT